MLSDARGPNLRIALAVCLLFLIAATSIAAMFQFWVLTAIPIGFLFGFFLQKGNLCGASAFSEVLLYRDWGKMWGLWVCVVTGMVGFAMLHALGWVKLNPKPFMWANHVLGGTLFGVGMVLAGGCVSGCLFKAGTGNLNSMVALLAIALGVSLIEHGPLHSAHAYLKTLVVGAPGGGSLTLSSMTGLPFWLLTLFFAVVTIGVSLAFGRRKRGRSTPTKDGLTLVGKVLTRPWKPWQAGLLIGLLGSIAYLSSAESGRNYPLGVTHGVLHAQLVVTDHNLTYVFKKKPVQVTRDAPNASESRIQQSKVTKTPTGKKISWWLVALVLSLVVGSWTSGRLSGKVRLLPKPPEQTIIAFFGGLLVGTGAAVGMGCIVGNIMSGWALMSVGCVLFGVTAMLANWATTYFYLMGGRASRQD